MEVRPAVLDDVLEILRDRALPVTQAKPGLKSCTALVDRAVGRVIVLTLWESQEASRADDTGRVIQQHLEQLSRYVTSVMITERYEVAFELPGLGA